MMNRPRFSDLQQNRTISHPLLPQPDDNLDDDVRAGDGTEMESHSAGHSFVVVADTQLGVTNQNTEWETELQYSREAVSLINAIEPRPAFCCMCGDLVDMESSFFAGKGFTTEECDRIQDRQNYDFKQVWSELHEDIPLVCLCGNHDVGNRPTRRSITRFKNSFGDDYLAFWVNGTYNIFVNTNLFSDPNAAPDLYEKQLEWLEERLRYAKLQKAQNIFVFGHHPWFLYQEDEEMEDLKGISPFPEEWESPPNGEGFKDFYFHIPSKYRKHVMSLFKEYNVSAAFSGHFHQNLVSKSSFGMDMIITSSLSVIFDSSGKPKCVNEPSARGIRIVDVVNKNVAANAGTRNFQHRFVPLQN